ncbi:hypothetical protein K493DRAFT_320046 [Basidiobolus meristosporus CBS 931.73]|uniref:Citrate transporter-like domain-containing protein n=1 Tax=Basidiobolus meristosporus CBS 931.73 TaxID=1314790 RepID=A0A1Y1XGH5_9FUNG|nr:hypothetical protein K493DRAFT_320046 [Basidiobolus meristosporus CBS 931.73]|eukprot:ORX84855.1 hypothetical protein K493DRAFT_320046 [Basidiobolus meristosporus CBS 931.73]
MMEATDIQIPRLDYHSYQTYTAILICVIALISFAKVRAGLNINRSIFSLIAGGSMVALDVITPAEAYSSLHGSTLLLLFAFMIIMTRINDKGFVYYFRQILLKGAPTPLNLMLRLSLLSGLLGFFFMSDISAVYVCTVVITLCEDYSLNIEPFAVAAVTSSNIGSIASVVGNINSLLAHEMIADLDFNQYFLRMSIPAFVGLLVNAVFLGLYYRRSLPVFRLQASSYAEHNHIAINSPEFYKIAEEYRKAAQNRNTLYIDERLEAQPVGPICINIHDGSAKEDTPLLGSPVPIYCEILSTSPESIPVYETIDAPPSTPIDPSVAVLPIPRTRCPPSPPPTLLIPPAGFSPSSSSCLSPNSSCLSPCSSRYSPTRKKHGLFFDKTIIGFLEFWRDHYRSIIFGSAIVFMYTGIALENHVGWTALVVALIIALVENRDGHNDLFADLDFPSLAYYFGLFIMIRGIQETPLLIDAWKLACSKLAVNDNPIVLLASLVFFVTSFNIVLSPVATLLLLLPLMENMIDEIYGQKLIWLLVWCIALTSNLLFTGSAVGFAMNETIKFSTVDSIRTHFGKSRIWLRYSLWTTPIIMVLGIAIICLY